MNMTNIMRSLKLFNFYSKFFLMLSKKKKREIFKINSILR